MLKKNHILCGLFPHSRNKYKLYVPTHYNLLSTGCSTVQSTAVTLRMTFSHFKSSEFWPQNVFVCLSGDYTLEHQVGCGNSDAVFTVR